MTIFESPKKTTTKCNILSTFTFTNYGKFADHNLEKLCPWPRESLSSKSRSLAANFFESLASNVVSSTLSLLIVITTFLGFN